VKHGKRKREAHKKLAEHRARCSECAHHVSKCIVGKILYDECGLAARRRRDEEHNNCSAMD